MNRSPFRRAVWPSADSNRFPCPVILNVMPLRRMAENPYKPPAAKSAECCRTSATAFNRFRYLAGLLVAGVAGLIAAPMAFASMWGWGDYAAGNTSNFSGGILLTVILAIGVLVSSSVSSCLLNKQWALACALLCLPTILLVGDTVLRNDFSMATKMPLLSVVAPAIIGALASKLFCR